MRIPIIAQLEEADCGPAALASIAAAHGAHHSVPDLARLAGAGRDGTSAAGLLRAARAIGLTGTAVRATDPRAVALPAIALLAGHHFVIVSKVRGDRVQVIDPASGRSTQTVHDFVAQCRGLYLTFEAGADLARCARPVSATRRLWLSMRRGEQARLLWAAVAALVVSTTVLALASWLRSGTAATLPVWLVIGTLLAVAVAAPLLAWWGSSVCAAAISRLTVERVEHLTARLLSVKNDFLERRFLAEVAMRPQRLDTVLGASVQTLVTCSAAICTALVTVGVLTFVEPYVAATAVIGVTVGLALTAVCKDRAAEFERRLGALTMRRDGDLLQSLASMHIVRAEAAADDVRERWARAQQDCDDVEDRLFRVTSRRTRLMTVIDTGTLVAVVVIAVLHHVPTEAVVIAPLITSVFLTAVHQIEQLQTDGRASLEAGWRAVDDLNSADIHPSETQPAATASPAELSRTVLVRCDAASFSVPGPRARSVGPLTMQVCQGDNLLVLGGSGNGKSTALRMMAGFLPARSGHVGLRTSRVGYVPQRPTLLDGTVRENLCFGRQLDDAALLDALDRVRLHDVVRRRGGLDAVVLHGGANFSGGERQRFALARALADRPDLLLLDEALSAVEDAVAEVIVTDLATCESAVVLVAHRVPQAAAGFRALTVHADGSVTITGCAEQEVVA
ncbi:cysteine peptidase family C39 domain-containing protein [Flexivirga caeni]|uniref:ATP-binding cassette domain-containing protein n=1 Tax=Flexivirga caeni TaxID=2294115 RepID=A0A3M9M6B3_9MICO|nr:cysteine peptidase family C39 domain-containing protein [Flexivirga caeni]RNI21114.1 ATP-binding cassette domain-containing protein [Flexivirga caeni]